MILNPYLKFIVALLSAMLTSLAAYYGHTAWYPVVTAAVGAALVYLVPNLPATPAPRPPLP
jgi:hypothetical protein